MICFFVIPELAKPKRNKRLVAQLHRESRKEKTWIPACAGMTGEEVCHG